MADTNANLKSLVQKYILKIGGLLKEEVEQPQFAYGFRFLYPNEKGRVLMAVQPKGKDWIELSSGTQLSPEHKKAFMALPERDRKTFIKSLNKLLYQTELEYSYNFSQKYMIVLIDKLFIEDDQLSINQFYRSARALYYNSMKLVIFIQEFFSDELTAADLELK
jgi:hypothetical protein